MVAIRIRSRRAALLAALLWMTGCNDLDAVSEDLRARTDRPQAGPNCTGCHPYPPRDMNHMFHLFQTDSLVTSNRPITCLHCHNSSLASHKVALPDSIFVDGSGNEFRALDFPKDTLLRTFPLRRVDTLVQIRPVPQEPRPGRKPPYQEWITALAHMNGVVDVVFDSTSVDTAKFGAEPLYRPEALTCSAVACHPNHGDYRWPIPSQGLPILRGHEH